MGEQSSNSRKTFDPMEPFRGIRDTYLDAWAKSMVDMVNTEEYAQATGAMLDSYLTLSSPFREAVEKAMLKTLEQLSMPTRADVVSIAGRMTNIEMRLDDLDAKLDGIRKLLLQAPGPSSKNTSAAQARKKSVRPQQARRGKK